MDPLKLDATGDPQPKTFSRDVQFGPYVISVVVGPGNEFLGIQGIAVRKDFLSPSERVRATGYHDVSEFYKE